MIAEDRMGPGRVVAALLGATALAMIASTAFYNSPEQVRQRTLEKLVAEDIAREAAKSPMQRRAEREAREAYDRSLTECYFAAIEKHGMDGYDRELDCGHIGERP